VCRYEPASFLVSLATGSLYQTDQPCSEDRSLRRRIPLNRNISLRRISFSTDRAISAIHMWTFTDHFGYYQAAINAFPDLSLDAFRWLRLNLPNLNRRGMPSIIMPHYKLLKLSNTSLSRDDESNRFLTAGKRIHW
jgi:hypothetical protein